MNPLFSLFGGVALLAAAAQAEKHPAADGPEVLRLQLDSSARVANCATVSGFPTGVYGTATLELTEDCCNWTIGSCGSSLVDSWFRLFGPDGNIVAANDDGRCGSPCGYGPALLASDWGNGCLAAGVYTLSFYVFSYKDNDCNLVAPYDWDICWEFCGGTGGTPDTPLAFGLEPAFPNPFNPTTTIDFTLANTGETHLTVFDLAGREVARLADGVLSAGAHSVVFDASELASGVYVYTLDAEGFSTSRRMVLVK
jgi:hypothetical protein